jgi:hypothetical protein
MTAVNQQERRSITHELKYYLAGFIEGEGSVTVSIKEHPTIKYGLRLDPEFFLYQHKAGIKLLELAQDVFGTGRIFPKHGSENVLVYSITSRRSLYERVIPFFEKYMIFSAKGETFQMFKEIVVAMEERKEHHTREGLIRLFTLAYQMNPYSKGKERKRTLQEVIDRILRDYTPESSDQLIVRI